MAFHVPFDHRRRMQPIYIGFDMPAPVKRQFNWWGFWGFGFSIMSLMTAGFLSPLALLVNLVGMRRRPRKLATAGLVISIIGSLMLTGIVTTAIASHRHREHRVRAHHEAVLVQSQVKDTQKVLAQAQSEFDEYRDANQGKLPAWIEANMVAIKHTDAWGQSIRFDPENGFAQLRSAGPDQIFDTRDDVLVKVKGQSDRATLLPVEAESVELIEASR